VIRWFVDLGGLVLVDLLSIVHRPRLQLKDAALGCSPVELVSPVMRHVSNGSRYD
jgi:hypothetical protein